MAAKVRLWRWRRNPLRRPTDVAEGWIGLATIALTVVLAPAAGAVAAVSVEDALLQHGQDWHRTSAVLTEDAAPADAAMTTGVDAAHVQATVRWTAPDDSVHTAVTQVAPGAKAGAATTIWTDAQGRLRSQPPSAAQAQAQGDLAGGCVAAGVVVLLIGGNRVIVRTTLDRRRAQDWERAWAEVEPRWSHGRT